MVQAVVDIMKERTASGRIPFSVEIFPPKGELSAEEPKTIASTMAPADPDFISVTCSAGGSGNGNDGRTVAVARLIQEQLRIPAVAHMTCVGATRETVNAADIEYACNQLVELAQAGVNGLLLYSMNKTEIGLAAATALKEADAR